MTFKAERQEWEIRYWRRLLKKHRGSIKNAAREAGLYRQNVYRTLERLGIEIDKLQFGNDAWRALQEKSNHVDR